MSPPSVSSRLAERPATLRIIATRHPGEQVVGSWVFEQSTVRIGRSPKSADIKVEDKTISRDHCLIEARAEGIFARDLGSSNGTWVNGRRISEVKLEPADVVSVGHLRLKIAHADEHTVLSGGAPRRLPRPVGPEALRLGPLPAIEINQPKPVRETRLLPPWDARTARVIEPASPAPLAPSREELLPAVPEAKVLPFSPPYAEPGDTDVMPVVGEKQVQFEVDLDAMLDDIGDEARPREPAAEPAKPAEATPADVESPVASAPAAPEAAAEPVSAPIARIELVQVPQSVVAEAAPAVRPFSSVAKRGARKKGAPGSTVLIVGAAAIVLAGLFMLAATVVALTLFGHHRIL